DAGRDQAGGGGRLLRPTVECFDVSGACMAKKRVAVLISGRGSNMASLVEAAKEPSYPAEIVLVVSNNPQAPGLAHTAAHAIAAAVIDHPPHGHHRPALYP